MSKMDLVPPPTERLPTPRPGSLMRMHNRTEHARLFIGDNSDTISLNDETFADGLSGNSTPRHDKSPSSLRRARVPGRGTMVLDQYDLDDGLVNFDESFLTDVYGLVERRDLDGFIREMHMHPEANRDRIMRDLRQRLELMYIDQFDSLSTDEDFLEALELSRNEHEHVAPKPNYLQGADVVDECLICLDTCPLHKRLCCLFPVCDACMNQYLETQVNQGIVKIPCISGICEESVHRDEILGRLSDASKDKYYKFLVDANMNPKIKTCPRCNYIYKVKELGSQDRGKYGALVMCPECRLDWCFTCQAPYHVGVKCKDFKKGDKLLRKWAGEQHFGRTNAQKCPKCKVFIERKGGCDQMICTQCVTSFCYRCGGRFVDLKFFGNHLSPFSPFGCKYQLLPGKPVLRRVIRGSVFGGQMLLGLFLASVGVVAVGTLIGASVVILPVFGAYKFHRRRKFRRRMKRQETLFKRVELQREKAAAERYTEKLREMTRPANKVGESVDTFNIGIQTGPSEHVDVTVHNPYHGGGDSASVPTSEDSQTQTLNSEIRMNISDEKGQVTVTTAEITHNPLANGDGSEAEVVLHVKTTYGSAHGSGREKELTDSMVEGAKKEANTLEGASEKMDDENIETEYEHKNITADSFKPINHYKWKRKTVIKAVSGEVRSMSKHSGDAGSPSNNDPKRVERHHVPSKTRACTQLDIGDESGATSTNTSETSTHPDDDEQQQPSDNCDDQTGPLDKHDEKQTSDNHDEKQTSDNHDANQTSDCHDEKQTSDCHDANQTSDCHDEKQTSDNHDEKQTSDNHDEKQTSDCHDANQTSDCHDEKQTSDYKDEKQTSDYKDEKQTPDNQSLNNDDENSPKDSQTGCLLKLFSKKLNTFQNQLDKDKQLTSKTLSDLRDAEHLDCPDIVACALEAELKQRDGTREELESDPNSADVETTLIGLVNMETRTTSV